MEVKVLMIDDDEVIAESTAEYFNMFDVKTEYVTSFEAAVEFLENNLVSLLLMDINLGDKSGFELCKKVRERYDMPILFISARTSDDDVLIALNIGGDDYIKKPYTLSVLLAKVKAILSRYEKAREAAKSADAGLKMAEGGNISSTSQTIGNNGQASARISSKDGILSLSENICLDTNIHKLIVGGEQQNLKAMEYKLLLYLLENAGRVVTKDELLKNVWEDEYIGEGTLAVHIRHIREKIETDPKEPAIVKTVWGVGYMVE